jgi:hypothetical protein
MSHGRRGSLREDGSVLLLRVAPRNGGPHMLQSYKQHRYYARRGTRTIPMGEDEIRRAYEAATARDDELERALHQLPLLARVGRTRGHDALRTASTGHPMPDDLPPLVTVVVAPFVSREELIPAERIQLRSFQEPVERYVGGNRTLCWQGMFDVDAWGLIEQIAADDDPNLVLNHVRVFRAGVFEWARRYGVPDQQGIPTSSFAHDVHNPLSYVASIYDAVGYTGRVAIFVRVENAEKAWLSINERFALIQRRRADSISGESPKTVTAIARFARGHSRGGAAAPPCSRRPAHRRR